MSCGQGGPRREGRQLTKARMAAVARTLIDVFITAAPITKFFAVGEGESGGMCYERRRDEACVD